MACIKNAARSALVAFATDAPYLAAGTMAGAVDLSFSSSANLDIFRLDFGSDDPELPLAASCPSSDRFNSLAWGKPPPASSHDFPLGLLAGGLTDGSIALWNPHKLISTEGQDDAVVARLEKHKGPVRGLEFGPNSPNLLASGADEGELCIWDLAKPAEPVLFPSLKNAGSGAQTEVSSVSWNPKFQHILASTSYNGITAVWDLRQQKTVTSFSDRRRCSVLQWNPDISTQLILASDDDSSPSLRVWDVRKTMSPSREFVGHTKGVIAMSWCPIDSSYLLTCAKDNRTVCWDTVTGEIICELPASNNWNFDIHWYPKVPGVISASSFDAKIGIYNIEACERLAGGPGESGASARLRAPKWLKRSTGASFGFGGKLVSFRPIPPVQNAPSRLSEIFLHDLVTENSLVSRSTEFQAAIQNGEKASPRTLCDNKSQDSESPDDKEIWAFLRVMLEEGTARSKLLDHLGFCVPNQGSENASHDLGKDLTNTLNFGEKTAYEGALVEGEGATFPIDDGENFFNNPQPSVDNVIDEDNAVPNGKEVSTKTEEHQESSDPSFDDSIQHALIVGDYKEAVSKCISANRMADALVIAHLGGPLLWNSTRDQYLNQSHLPYLKVASALVANDLMGLVNSRPLNYWKETLALLCTFAQDEEWTVLCDTLASRLMAVGNTPAATLCYICAGNIDRTVEIWSHSLKYEHEGRTYVDLLQDLMEKTVILAFAIGRKQFSASLSKLVENYAELLASQGLLTTAMEYLNLLGLENYPLELSILRDRIASSVGEKETPVSVPENTTQQPYYDYSLGDGSRHPYQDKALPQPHHISGNTYVEEYPQNAPRYGVYEPRQRQNPPEHQKPSLFQPNLPPGVFVPTPQIPQQSVIANTGTMQPLAKPYDPVTPAVDGGLYQPNTLGSQLGIGNPIPQPGLPGYSPVGGNPIPQPGPPGYSPIGGNAIPQPGPPPAHTFVPGHTGFVPAKPGFVPRPSMSPVQPSSPIQAAQLVTPPAPPPTVQTVDTSNVPAELRPVILTLMRLFHESSEAVGGSRANPSKKREIEDNSKKIGSLFAKLNGRDISPSAASKLSQLCQALDSGDFAGALRIQVSLTTSDWDECNFWLTALKRMIKTRQTVR